MFALDAYPTLSVYRMGYPMHSKHNPFSPSFCRSLELATPFARRVKGHKNSIIIPAIGATHSASLSHISRNIMSLGRLSNYIQFNQMKWPGLWRPAVPFHH